MPTLTAAASSLFEVVAQHASEAGDALAAVDLISHEASVFREHLTYKELAAGAERLAAGLSCRLQTSHPEWTNGGSPPVVASRMQRGNEWYALFLAAAKLQIPFVALSVDLPDKSAEESRNDQILKEHEPAILVIGGGTNDGSPPLQSGQFAGVQVGFRELWDEGLATLERGRMPSTPSPVDTATLCFAYTGGTTSASRCAIVTHRMALHEVRAYPGVVRLGRVDRVLQQHSLYWAASAFGELDIALAFGCAVVFCEAWGIDDIAAAIKESRAACAGLVPSILAALDPSELPSLKVVFTWGEALEVKMASEWTKRVHLVDLLISTECWLSFYADWSCGPLHDGQPPLFQHVDGTQVRLRPVVDEGEEAAEGALSTSELLVAGPMVSPGYTDAARNATVFMNEAGIRWYCTRDCVKTHPGGLLGFVGRADDLVKVGGVWVDVRDVEQKLAAVRGVQEARVFRSEAFVALASLQEGAVPELRSVLPPTFALYILPAPLPRRDCPPKVDRKKLFEMVTHRRPKESLDNEANRITQDLRALWKWTMRPGLLLLFGAVFYSTRAQPFPICTDEEVAGGDVAACPPTWMAWAPSFLLRLFWEILWRYILLSYAAFAHLQWPRLDRKFHSFPYGYDGFTVVAAAIVPGPITGLCLASPAIYHITCRGRLLAWPVLCTIGFSVWARETHTWWANQGCLGALQWYSQSTRGAVGRLVARWSRWFRQSCGWTAWTLREAFWRTGGRLGLARKCATCKEWRRISKGHVDLAVDPGWYCESCWESYKKHRLCTSCSSWVIRGREDTENGEFLCGWCFSRAKGGQEASPTSPPSLPPEKAPSGSDDGSWAAHYRALSLGGGGGGGGGGNGGGGGVSPGSAGGGNWGRLQRRTITLTDEPALVGDSGGSSPGLVPAFDSPLGGTGEPHGVAEPAQVAHGSLAPRSPGAAAAAGVGAAGAASAAAAAGPVKTPMWLLLERASGWSFSSREDSLASLDSLRHAKIGSALFREVGVKMPRSTLRSCKSLGALMEEIERLTKEQQLSKPASSIYMKPVEEEHMVWGLMWHSKCHWILHRDCPLPEAILRKALEELVERHPALRTELVDPMRLFTATQQAFTAFEMWRIHRASKILERGDLRAWLARKVIQMVRWSFWKCWPRVRAAATPIRTLPLTVAPHAPTLEDARNHTWPQFQPPLLVCLAPFGEGAKEGALVHITVTHMLSDGYSLVPILADLSQFVCRAEAAAAASGGGGPIQLPPAPPPLPSAFMVMEHRIHDCITKGCRAAEAPTPEPIGRSIWEPRRDAATIISYLGEEIVLGVRQAAKNLAVSDDIVLLAAVGTAFARHHGRKVVPLATVAPQRDGPQESEMVGLFADLRLVNVHTGGLSYAGVAVWLHHVVKERLWEVPPLATQQEVPFVNFEWTDFEQRHGFTQYVNLHDYAERLQQKVKIAVDQPDRHTWRLRAAFDRALYNQASRDLFLELFQQSLRALLQNPLALVWEGE